MRAQAAASRLSPVLVVGVMLLYVPFVGGGWMTDDFNHAERARRATVAAAVASPDPFGFYRPLPQLSFLADARLWPGSAATARLVNVVLHGCVIAAAFLVATRLGNPRSAWLATLAFALTPKAHPIAVLWISARPELLAALFSLLAIAAWLSWVRGGRRVFLLAAVAGYAGAILSKESAALLPALLLLTPPDARTGIRRRVLGIAWLAVAAAAVIALRITVDALLPVSADGHYTTAASPERWLISLKNYLPRTVPPAVALVAVVGAARLLASRAERADPVPPGPSTLALAVYAVAWFLVFIFPVLPLVARSELYVYLAGFGFCLLSGHIADRAFSGCRAHSLYTAVGIYVAIAGAYLVSRNRAIHDDLVFSRRFVEATARDPILATHRGAVLVVPADPASDRALRDAIGGYVTPVLHLALKRSDVYGWASYAAPPVEAGSALRLICEVRDGVPIFRGADGAPR